MANKRVVATITAVATSAALLLGGTMAWQSISQTALNEATAVVNPGGRLHDDFDGTNNKDIYVENFAEEPIFARIRLDEYFDIRIDDGQDPMDENDIVEIVVGTYTDATGTVQDRQWDDPSTFLTHQFDEENPTDKYWIWLTGGSTNYIPTFNKNKDSLRADINGTLRGVDKYYPWEINPATGIYSTDAYSDYEDYANGLVISKEGTEVYDKDSDDIEEMNGTDPITGEELPDLTTSDVRTVPNQTHSAKPTEGASLISMDEWETKFNSQPGPFWVYDDDGWVYWAQPILPDTATGLLLDKIQLRDVMDDGWYYAINAVAQFITADDLGQGSGTGFYDADAGLPPTDRALKLLDAIGVDTSSVVHADPDPALTEEQVKEKAAENLQASFDKGGKITILDEVTNNAARDYNGVDYNYYWTNGGELLNGIVNLNNPTDTGLLIVAGDDASITDTIINSSTPILTAVEARATKGDIALKGIKINSDHGGIYVYDGSKAVELDRVTIDASNVALPAGANNWRDSALAASRGSEVTINGGFYEGTNAVYSLSTSKVTINSGSFVGDVKATNDGNIIINDGTFNGDIITGSSSGGTITINGGTFNGDINPGTPGSITIVDGTFNGKLNGTFTLTGGTYSFDPSKEANITIASGYEVVRIDETTYVVQPEQP